ncbi:MAG: 2-amino-4-hydroxy-6-hydroxymethyldihydropteridine diphosphokinase [Anaerolineaceae bacterium]|nr:2-amino-4-hydroxy-6-hydroxymethyldihydropteridine diphosphokinase [Anaerolineaceae bacterium]
MTEHVVWLSLGSNIRPRANLRAALRMLRLACRVECCSPVYLTAARGDSNQPDFLNMALRARTRRQPVDFHDAVIQTIENRLKRRRVPGNRNAARTIDVDISLWNDASLEFGEPPRQLPDPDILRYPHVARPLAALDPDYRHPLTGQSLREIAEALGTEGIRQLEKGLAEGSDELSP